jgi:uncharacterized DUF497 family protein
MHDQNFEWDSDKAAANWRDHGVTFDQATKAVRDAFAIEAIDERENYGEERVNLIGVCDGTLLHVTYTERGERIRIISARRAQRHEQGNYFRANTSGRNRGGGAGGWH